MTHIIAHEDFPMGQDSDTGDLETEWAWEGGCLSFNKKFKCRKIQRAYWVWIYRKTFHSSY